MFCFMVYSDTKTTLKMMSLITTWIIVIILTADLKLKYQVQTGTKNETYADLHSICYAVITIITIYLFTYTGMNMLLPIWLKRF